MLSSEKKRNWSHFQAIKMLYQIIWNRNPAGKFATRLLIITWLMFAVFIFHWHWIVYLFYSSNIHLCKSINTPKGLFFSQQWKIPCQWRNWHARRTQKSKKKLRTLEITRNTFFSIYISYHRNLFITSK